MNARLMEDGTIYVVLSDGGAESGASGVIFLKPGDDDYDEFLKDAVPVRVMRGNNVG